MSESANWQASLLEQRMAWGIAAGCIILVVLASARPEWFDFSGPKQKQVATLSLSGPAKTLDIENRLKRRSKYHESIDY